MSRPADGIRSRVRGLWVECGYAWRLLRSAPLAVATAIVVLAVAAGASVSVFAVVDALLLRTVAAPEAERLVRLSLVTPSGNPLRFSLTAFEGLAFQPASAAAAHRLVR